MRINWLFIFLLSFYSLSSYGQVEKEISIKSVSGISNRGNKYIVKDVDLKGNTLVFPPNSRIVLKNGKISNGTVVFDNAFIEGEGTIDVEVKGTVSNEEIKAAWFGIKAGSREDQTKSFQRMLNFYDTNVSHNSWDINLKNPEPAIYIPSGKYNVGEVILRSYVTIKGDGRGSTELRGVTFKAKNQYNITIEDLSIVGSVGATKKTKFNLEDAPNRLSAFELKDCARLLFKNVCVKNYDIAFDMYNTYLVDLYSCFVSYCNVCYLNDGKGNGYGGHAVRWFGGEMYDSKYGFVQTNGSGVLLNGATIEGCRYGVNLIYPTSFSVNACYFEANNYDIYGTVVHVNIENNYFSESGKEKGDAYIYAPTAIGYSVIQGNLFGKQVFEAPHIMIDDETKVYGNIMIGQNDIVHGGRIPVSDRLLSSVYEKGVNKFQTYLPDGKKMLMGQTIIYKNPQTKKYYIVTRDDEGNLLFSPFYEEQ